MFLLIVRETMPPLGRLQLLHSSSSSSSQADDRLATDAALYLPVSAAHLMRFHLSPSRLRCPATTTSPADKLINGDHTSQVTL